MSYRSDIMKYIKYLLFIFANKIQSHEKNDMYSFTVNNNK